LSFEVLEKDLLGRIGKLQTKRGVVETPLLLPVVNPMLQVVSPKELGEAFGCKAVITNAYLLRKNFGSAVVKRGVHDFLGFDHAVVTDSGAYQILVYGDIEATQSEIVAYEEAIDTDIAVMLDIPTGGRASRVRAEQTVKETLRRAEEVLKLRTRPDILWVGPVQGGNHLDLVALSAREIAKLPFDVYALGSPTQVMEQYVFDYLVEMTLTAKRNLPVDKPLHLFGAGHPFMFAFAVALGCDTFDSAAYAIYAREGKYMTVQGTERLSELRYFPCSCEVCSNYSPKEVVALRSEERCNLLARHNLAVCFEEVRNVKQAVQEGRLWELLERRARNHPSLFQAFKILGRHKDYLEENSPVAHDRGLLFFDSLSLARPEVVRYRMRLQFWPQTKVKVLVLLPEPSSKPFHRSREMKRVRTILRKRLVDEASVSFCICSAPFGITPLELDEMYPLSQFEAVKSSDGETREYVAQEVAEYLRSRSSCYERVILYAGGEFGEEIAGKIKLTDGRYLLTVLKTGEHLWGKEELTELADVVANACSTERTS
jgi:7-cyano-7-deazaguanine tRNA-ribosyltransferase